MLRPRPFVLALVLGSAAPACGGAAPATRAPSDEPALSASSAPAGKPRGGGTRADLDHAASALQRGDGAAAKKLLEAVVAVEPANGEALFYLGVVAEKDGDLAAAEARYRAALAADPGRVEAAQNLGALLVDAKRVDAAIEVLRAASKRSPADRDLHANLGFALAAKGERAAALTELEAATRGAGASPDARLAYASMLLDDGKKPEALVVLRALRGEATERALLATVARAFGQAGAYADCVGAFDAAIAAGAAAELHVGRGLCRHSLGDDAGAKGDFDAAVKLDPKSAAARYYRGEALVAAGDVAGGAAELDEAARLDPKGALGAKAKAKAESARKGGAGDKKHGAAARHP